MKESKEIYEIQGFDNSDREESQGSFSLNFPTLFGALKMCRFYVGEGYSFLELKEKFGEKKTVLTYDEICNLW